MNSQLQSRMMSRSARRDPPIQTRILIVQRDSHELVYLGDTSISRCSTCQPCTWPSQPKAHGEDHNCGSPDAPPWSWRSRPKGYDAGQDYMAIPATSACRSLCWCRSGHASCSVSRPIDRDVQRVRRERGDTGRGHLTQIGIETFKAIVQGTCHVRGVSCSTNGRRATVSTTPTHQHR